MAFGLNVVENLVGFCIAQSPWSDYMADIEEVILTINNPDILLGTFKPAVRIC